MNLLDRIKHAGSNGLTISLTATELRHLRENHKQVKILPVDDEGHSGQRIGQRVKLTVEGM